MPSFLSTKDNNTTNILHYASYNEHIGIIRSLCKYNLEYLDNKSKEGISPLEVSVLNKRYLSLATLLSNGAKSSSSHKWGSCLHFAVHSHEEIMVRELLLNKAPINI